MEILQLLAFLPIVLVIVWLRVEFGGATRAVRIGFGLASFAAAFIAAQLLHDFSQSLPRELHRASMRRMAELASQGDMATIQRALEAYNSTAGTRGSTSKAADSMWRVLSPVPHEQ